MTRLTAALVASMAAVIDGLAVLVASGYLSVAQLPSWPLAVGMHLAAMVICGVAAARFSKNRSTGALTMAILATVLAMVAPIAGALSVAAMLAGFAPFPETTADASRFVVGNPLVRRGGETIDEPVAQSLRRDHLDAVRRAGPMLHRDRDPAAVTVLRRLQQHPDAHTQLQAQAALAALGETAEQQLARLRAEAKSGVAARRQLASLLHHLAASGLGDSRESAALVDEAIGHLEQIRAIAPDDVESLHLLGRCRLDRGPGDAVADLIAQLAATPDGDHFAERLEIGQAAAAGQWRSVRDLLHRQGPRATNAAQRFWFAPSPISSPQPDVVSP